MIRALVFDFDGLILDTEVPEYRSWQEVYEEYGQHLPLERWLEGVGRAGDWDGFDPHLYLEGLLGRTLDREGIKAKHRRRNAELIASEPVLPGVEACIASAKRLGLMLGVASSSSSAWVAGHLSRLGLLEHFDCVKCGDDVERSKPDPGVYLEVLKALSLRGEEAIALEDSQNGLQAAKAAGLRSVLVPNTLTSRLRFDHADLVLRSLADASLEEILKQLQPGGPGSSNS